jgi:hypothetical protein
MALCARTAGLKTLTTNTTPVTQQQQRQNSLDEVL